MDPLQSTPRTRGSLPPPPLLSARGAESRTSLPPAPLLSARGTESRTSLPPPPLLSARGAESRTSLPPPPLLSARGAESRTSLPPAPPSPFAALVRRASLTERRQSAVARNSSGPRRSSNYRLSISEYPPEDRAGLVKLANDATANPKETLDAEIRELFEQMDTNNDERIAPKELDSILRALGINATEADLIEFISELPKEEGQDKDCVTFEQFSGKVKTNLDLANETDTLQGAFNAFDHTADGFLTVSKIRSVMSNLGISFPESDIQMIVNQVGTDGRISFDQFQTLMLNTDDIA